MELGQREAFYVTDGPQADSYSWTSYGSVTITSYNPYTNFAMVEATSTGYGYVWCRSINQCGESQIAEINVNVTQSGYLGFFKVYPNPADTYVVLEADETKMDLSEESVSQKLAAMSKSSIIRIVDKLGNVRLSEPYQGLVKTQIDVSKIPSDLYTIQLVTSKETFSTKLLVSH